MIKWVLAVFALSVVSGELPADLTEAQAASDEFLRGYVNETYSDTPGLRSYGQDAWIEQVNLKNCPNYEKYLPYFYGGLVVNSRGWMTKKGQERFTSMAIVDADGSVISSTSGAWPGYKNRIYHTWEMLHLGTYFHDIRTYNPGKVTIHSWNAGQQIYIPLFMADMQDGTAYMLHIYPDRAHLDNPTAYSYDDGVLWAKGGTNRLYKFEINIEGLIRNIREFSVFFTSSYIKAHGVIQTNSSGYQKSVAFSDVRQISAQATAFGSATEYICRNVPRKIKLTWAEMEAILKREFKWL